MLQKRHGVLLLAVILTLVSLIGITVSILNAYRLENRRFKFGATYMNMDNPFFVKLNEGIKKVIEENNGKLMVLDSQLDADKQIAQVEYLIEEGVDLIFLNPADWKRIKPALEAARQAKIPVIVVDAPVYNDELVDCTVVSDNYNAGVLCAADLVKQLEGKGNVILLEHPTAKSAIDRIEGFLSIIEKYGDIKVVARDNSNGQLEIAMQAMERILKSHKEIDAVMCLNDPTALGVVAALHDRKDYGGVLIYGIDGSSEAIRMIEEGKLTGTAAQYPEKIGEKAAETALKKLNGEIIEHYIKVPVKLINKENIEE